MARKANRAIGNKFGNLLGGLLGGLYAGSSAEPNAAYLPPGTEGPQPLGETNQPFKSGGGLFGGIKAKDANTQYAMSDMLASNNANRSFTNQAKLLPLQTAEAERLALSSQTMRADEANRLLGLEGQATGHFLGNLPTEQLSNVVPPTQTFSSPQEQQRYITSAYGDKTALNQLPIMADPRTKSAEQSAAIGKGLVQLGDTKANLDTNTAYTGASVQHETEAIPIIKKVMNLETGAMEDSIVGYKNISKPVSIPAGITNLADMRMSPDIVAATAQVTPGGEFPQSTVNPVPPKGYTSHIGPMGEFLSTDFPPMESTTPNPPPTPTMKPLFDPNRLEGLFPDIGRGASSAISATGEYLGEAGNAAATALRFKQLKEATQQGRKFLIRRAGEQY